MASTTREVVERVQAILADPHSAGLDRGEIGDLIDVCLVEAKRANAAEAKVSTLHAGLDAAHARIAELELKAANASGFETAQRLRARREQGVG